MLSKVVYEQKFNYHKNEKNNYKMNKYLNKLNIDGGAGPITLSPIEIAQIDTLPVIGSGSFGTVRKQGDIVIKKFVVPEYYLAEKKVYITYLTTFGGSIQLNIKNNKGDYYNNSKMIQLVYDENFRIDTIILIRNIVIFGNILEHLKTLFPIELIGCKQIYIKNVGNKYLSIFGIYDDKVIEIGTCIYQINGTLEEYNLYFNYRRIFKLLRFNDENLLLYYKNLGLNLSQMFNKEQEPDIISRELLCFDLIRQVYELVENGIYHNDIKLDNICVKVLPDGQIYLTLIDYGIAIKEESMLAKFDARSDTTLLTLYNAYSPEYYKIANARVLDIHRLNFLKLLKNMSHWIIGGICICILMWKNVQWDIFRMVYNIKGIPKDIDENEYILNLFGNEEFNEKYSSLMIDLMNSDELLNERMRINRLLYDIIIYLLQVGDKETLFVHYAKFKDLPEYQAYLEQRRLSGIDD